MVNKLNKYVPTRLAIWNANGIKGKTPELTDFLYLNDIDVIFITETHMRPTDNLKISNYKTFRSDRLLYKGGGSAIMVKTCLQATEYNISNAHGVEETSVLLHLPNSTCVKLVSIYNPPNHSIDENYFINLFKGHDTVVAGDFNAKTVTWGCKTNNKTGNKLYRTIIKHKLNVFAPLEPTYYSRINNYAPDILDFLVTNINNPFFCNVINDMSSDHRPVICNAPFNHVMQSHLIKKTDWTVYSNTLIYKYDELPLPKIDTTEDIEIEIKNLNEILTLAKTDSTEIDIRKPDYLKLPIEIKKKIRERNRIRRIYQNNFDPNLKPLINQLNREIKEESRKYKNECWDDKLQSLNISDNSVWRLSKCLKKEKPIYKPLKHNNQKIYSDEEKCEVFADSIEHQFTNNKKPICPTNINIVEQNYNQIKGEYTTDCNMDHTDIHEIKNIIKKLKKKKAPGADNIQNLMIKNLPDCIIRIITEIINKCISLKYFPTSWKHASIILIPKPGKDSSIPSNHRPISLLSVLGKIYEKIIYARLKPYLSFLPKEQYGFRENLSTVKQLLRITEFISNAFYKNQTCAMLMIDVAKAFDRVWHKGIIVKLNHFKIPIDLIQILDSYLANRTFSVKLPNAISTSRPIEAGVPQGSILGPVLYIIYTSDFPNISGPNLLTALYADDTAIISSSLNTNKAVENLQQEIHKIENWCKMWRVSINADKSNVLLIKKSRRKAKTDKTLSIFNTNVPIVTKAKYLGVTINFNLTWNNHIDNVIGKAWGAYSSLKSMIGPTANTPLHIKKLIYTQCIRPVVTYASPAWNAIPEKHRKRLDVFQNKILRQLTNAPYYVRNSTLHRDFNLDKLSNHISKINTNFFNKAVNCTHANFNEVFIKEIIREDIDHSPITAFFLSDAVLSKNFKSSYHCT